MSNTLTAWFLLLAASTSCSAQVPQMQELYRAGLALNTARFESDDSLCQISRDEPQANEVSRLLGAVKTPGLRDALGASPAYYAVMVDDLSQLKRLLGLGYDTSMPNGNTLLHVAAYWNSIDSARYLLDRGVSIDTTNSAGGTALMVAVSSGGPDVAKLLLSRGAHVNPTTLRYSLVCKDQEIVDLLLATGVEIDQKTRRVAQKLNMQLPKNGR